MFSDAQMIFISILCGGVAAGTYWVANRKEEKYKKQVQMLLYMIAHRQEAYNAEVIGKRKTEKGDTMIQIRYKDKNNKEVTRELPAPPDIKVGDTICIYKEEE